jgi:hypothetical protein
MRARRRTAAFYSALKQEGGARVALPLPEIVAAFDRQQARSFIADGEIVTFTDGLTSFAKLQHPRLLPEGRYRWRRTAGIAGIPRM